jgi:hypothetical protein
MGTYETQTMVRDPGFLCGGGGIALGLVRRGSNGCPASDAQNDRDEFGWLLNGVSAGFFCATRLL